MQSVMAVAKLQSPVKYVESRQCLRTYLKNIRHLFKRKFLFYIKFQVLKYLTLS
jgi:hypothetical protein